MSLLHKVPSLESLSWSKWLGIPLLKGNCPAIFHMQQSLASVLVATSHSPVSSALPWLQMS